ncbi:MAG: acetyltransferase [Candidatus Taylorbacteria bacterium CG11_big_fil_rev_8_21_14_0_20_46_11]|uniref:Acetyltransferase n=1 Tax=Candidatus Taylorbacteria bacterium CG11_big_fil_rev_8_21_14_0_20_46_11 TaxID=1975025 RepID=A0A2H0KCT0_9BACT|nr:MAG: acetyltransferase [Candidatus Taylorbacteria bacterium CG11_big_fil_rev_8_21_14_0_20_46_11]
MPQKRFIQWKKPVIRHGKPTKWNWLVLYPEGLILGKYTDIGAYTLLVAKHGIEIEDEVQIGSHCSVYSYSTIDDTKGKVLLKKGCRIGTHSSIMPGVTIGENAVVGAHSFVTKDVPPNTVVAGVPTKPLKSEI